MTVLQHSFVIFQDTALWKWTYIKLVKAYLPLQLNPHIDRDCWFYVTPCTLTKVCVFIPAKAREIWNSFFSRLLNPTPIKSSRASRMGWTTPLWRPLTLSPCFVSSITKLLQQSYLPVSLVNCRRIKSVSHVFKKKAPEISVRMHEWVVSTPLRQNLFNYQKTCLYGSPL